MSIAALAFQYRKGQNTPSLVVDESCATLRRWQNPGWLISLDEGQLRRAAEESSARLRAGSPRSPLEGVPIAIKDLFDVSGTTTSCGCSFLRTLALEDAIAVSRLRNAGAILFGKSNLYELGLGPTGENPHHGQARNPRNLDYDTGGSSSGTAALVAAGIVPCGLGSDLGGSLRIPAAHCGVTALKPTFARVPTQGMATVAPSLEHAGPIGATIDDLEIALGILADDLIGHTSVAHTLRVGVSETLWALAEPKIALACAEAARCLERLGARVCDVPFSQTCLERAHQIGTVVASAEAAATWTWALDSGQPFGAAVSLMLSVGRAISGQEYQDAQYSRQAVTAQMNRFWTEIDVLLTPTVPTTAPPVRTESVSLDEDVLKRQTLFTLPFNLGGLPALQVPWQSDAAGLPMGIQLVGPRGSDAQLLAVGRVLEANAGWRPYAEPILRL